MFIFVIDGIESALEQAKTVTGDRDIVIGDGASAAQQYLKAGLLDEVQIHLVPVLFGEGIRLFNPSGGEQIELEKIMVIEGSGVTHLRFRLIK